jgi:hypothetical protein
MEEQSSSKFFILRNMPLNPLIFIQVQEADQKDTNTEAADLTVSGAWIV